MKRLSRHTVVVLLVALLSSVGGLTLAVVAFGQGNGTSTTGTAELSPYATTPSTTPTVTTPTTSTETSSTTPSEATTTNGNNPERAHGKTVPVDNGGGPPPSRITRKGPSHLAFTGAEPLYVGLLGVALMLGGLTLHRRRRAATER